MSDIDVRVTDNGTTFSFEPVSAEAQEWFEENVESEEWQWLGRTLVVDHRLAGPLAEGIMGSGLIVEGERENCPWCEGEDSACVVCDGLGYVVGD